MTFARRHQAVGTGRVREPRARVHDDQHAVALNHQRVQCHRERTLPGSVDELHRGRGLIAKASGERRQRHVGVTVRDDRHDRVTEVIATVEAASQHAAEHVQA